MSTLSDAKLPSLKDKQLAEEKELKDKLTKEAKKPKTKVLVKVGVGNKKK